MVRFGRFVLAVVATAVVSLGNDVNAGVIYDNTTLASNGYVEASVDGPLFNSFSTGGTGFLLTDVKLVLASTNVSSGKSFTVSLVANNANKPGTVLNSLATINDSSLSVAGSTIDVSVSSIALTANTRYWIEVNGAGGSSVEWSYGVDATGTGVPGEYWAYNPGGTLTVTQNDSTNTPFQMQVTATAVSSVPEPGTLSLALSALGIGVLGMARRRLVRA